MARKLGHSHRDRTATRIRPVDFRDEAGDRNARRIDVRILVDRGYDALSIYTPSMRTPLRPAEFPYVRSPRRVLVARLPCCIFILLEPHSRSGEIVPRFDTETKPADHVVSTLRVIRSSGKGSELPCGGRDPGRLAVTRTLENPYPESNGRRAQTGLRKCGLFIRNSVPRRISGWAAENRRRSLSTPEDYCTVVEMT